MGGPRWAEAERDLLRDLYPTGGVEAVAAFVDRSVKAIYWMAARMGVERMGKTGWRTAETVAKMGAVLEYVIAFKREHDGLSPTVREIGRVLGIPSTSHVARVLGQLEQEGKIRRDPHGIVVVGGWWTMEGE